MSLEKNAPLKARLETPVDAPLFARRVIASPCAGLLIHWMTERYGDLALFHIAHEGAQGEVGWCSAAQFSDAVQRGASHVQCGEIGGCRFYVARGNLELMRPGHIAVDIVFEGSEEAMAPRLVSHIRPLTAEEIEQHAAIRDGDGGGASGDFLWEAEQVTLALFGRLSASARP